MKPSRSDIYGVLSDCRKLLVRVCFPETIGIPWGREGGAVGEIQINEREHKELDDRVAALMHALTAGPETSGDD